MCFVNLDTPSNPQDSSSAVFVDSSYLPYLQEADSRAKAGEPVYSEEEFRKKAEAALHELLA